MLTINSFTTTAELKLTEVMSKVLSSQTLQTFFCVFIDRLEIMRS